MTNADAPVVVIVGGGFAGQHAYRELVAAGDYRVLLVDRHPYSNFQPLLYQVATGGMNPGDVAYSLREFVARKGGRGSLFRRGTATGIDHENKVLHVSRGEPIGYDKLILAAGVGANYFGIPGAAEYTHTIYTRAEAIKVRDLIFSGLERVSQGEDPDGRFTVLVVGGGATGVEMAGTLAEMKSEALPLVYPELTTDSMRVVLAEMAPTLLGPFKPELQDYTLDELRKRGVDVRLNTAVEEVRPGQVDLDGQQLDADLVVWASGVAAHEVVQDWGMPLGKGGRIEVDEHYRVLERPDVYAVGDCAVQPDDALPQLAPPAIQTGTHAAKHLIATDRGEPIEPFRYRDKGTMATIGRSDALVQFPGGRAVTGFPAWAMWAGVHLATLLGGRNRIQAMINGSFRYLAWPKSATAIVGDVISPDEEHESR